MGISGGLDCRGCLVIWLRNLRALCCIVFGARTCPQPLLLGKILSNARNRKQATNMTCIYVTSHVQHEHPYQHPSPRSSDCVCVCVCVCNNFNWRHSAILWLLKFYIYFTCPSHMQRCRTSIGLLEGPTLEEKAASKDMPGCHLPVC